MKKCVILLIIFLFLSQRLIAKDLFISTDPINAAVYVGDDLLGRSPLRIGSLEANSTMSLRIVKSGYEEVEMEVELDDKRTQLLYLTLYTPNVDFILSQRGKAVYVNDVNAGESPLVLQNLPNGTYSFESDQERITISNAEFARMKKTTKWEIASSAFLFGGTLAGGIYMKNNDNGNSGDLFLLSSAIFGGILGYNLLKLWKINLNEKRDRAEMNAIEISEISVDADRDMFTNAMEYMGKEYWDDALGKFKLLVSLYPDSQYVPMSLYQTGTIHFKNEEYEKASTQFQRFVYDYPVIEFYTFAVYDLIESELRLGNASEALGHYESLRPIYIDDPSGTLHYSYYELLVNLFEETDSQRTQILLDLKNELDHFLNTYADTYFYPDVLLLKGRLLYEHLDRDEGLALLQSLTEEFSQRQEILDQVEELLDAR
jgi:tetratricopeptide (TPR) repeat protein